MAPIISVIANNIDSNNGLNGGFSLPNNGMLNLQFYGNVNNPNGSGSFLNNYVPVAVANNGSKAGTATVTFAGPSYLTTSGQTTAQNVNLLVQGNVNLADGPGNLFGVAAPTLVAAPGTGSPTPFTPIPFPTKTVSPYANNHLVVTATGNIGLSPSQVPGLANPNIFYWPGLVWLTSGATASNPSAPPNATASISLGTTTGATISLSNIIPADLTKASVSGSIGQGGVHFLTNNLSLAPGTGATATVTISNNSWANFLTPALATAFQTTSGAQFFGGTIQTNGQINTQTLPAANFQP